MEEIVKEPHTEGSTLTSWENRIYRFENDTWNSFEFNNMLELYRTFYR